MNLKLAMNTGTFNLGSIYFQDAVRAISKAGFTGIDPRDNHIQEYLEKGHSIQDVKKLLEENQLHPIAMNSLRDWQTRGGKTKGEYRKLVEHYLEQSKGMGCDYVICCAFAEKSNIDTDTRHFKEVCDIAKSVGIEIVLEFLPWVTLRDVRTAWEVVRRANCSNSGLLIDTFHYFKGGSRIEDLREVPAEKIFFIHLDDAPDLPIDTKEMCMNHRVFPGEGAFPLRQFLDVLILEKKYDGWIGLEVLNKEYQHVDYSQIAEKGRRTAEEVLRCYGL
jgi:4-hydroxyphenylpyruvate dioxygenase